MTKEIIVTGKTFEDAMAEAQAKYTGVDVKYEILSMPKKGFLGIGSSPAKIKVIITEEDEDDTDLSDIVSSIKGLGVTTNKGGGDEKKPEAKKPEKKNDKKSDKKPEKKADKKPEKKADKKPERKEERKPEPSKAPVIKEAKVIEITDKEREIALQFANTLLKDMGIEAEAKFTGNETTGVGGNTYPRMEIFGEGAGILIGHHGETLDAIQYLVNLCAHRNGDSGGKEFIRIVVDIEDYRAKREETLRALARRTAEKVARIKRNVVLEPMNPFERRIIHSEIQDIENISTHSVGSDENRKIVVCYEGADKVQRRRKPKKASDVSNAVPVVEEADVSVQEEVTATEE